MSTHVDAQDKVPARLAALPIVGAAAGAAVLGLIWTSVYLALEGSGRGMDDRLAATVALGVAVAGSFLGMVSGSLLGARRYRQLQRGAGQAKPDAGADGDRGAGS